MSYDYTNVGHYVKCNKDKIKTLMVSTLHLTVISSCFWQSENEDTVMLFRAKMPLTP